MSVRVQLISLDKKDNEGNRDGLSGEVGSAEPLGGAWKSNILNKIFITKPEG